MRRAWIVGAALVLYGAAAPAQESARALHDRGLALYEEGRYEEAADAFADVLESGIDDARVHYNLANARFKEGRLGFAIWHYRRALQLAPRDEDVRANLEYARFLALDNIEAEMRTDTKVPDWLDRVTAREVLRLANVVWILAGGVLVAWQLRGAPRLRRAGTALLVVWGAAILVSAIVDRRASRSGEAVVLAREATVRNGPGESFETAFELHEGAEVVVEGERGAWTEISLPGDLRGWIDSGAIARL